MHSLLASVVEYCLLRTVNYLKKFGAGMNRASNFSKRYLINWQKSAVMLMTLFDLALKNILRNLKSYGLYIGSTIFSIVIYFTFVTLKYSEDISALSETSKRISGLMSASAFVLMIFVAIFIAYSNSFFMKKRKKEVALYALMGVHKRSIGWMLFFENMVIGFISLAVGVVLGFLLSRLLL